MAGRRTTTEKAQDKSAAADGNDGEEGTPRARLRKMRAAEGRLQQLRKQEL